MKATVYTSPLEPAVDAHDVAKAFERRTGIHAEFVIKQDERLMNRRPLLVLDGGLLSGNGEAERSGS